MADLDMGKLPKVEDSGERCVRRIQEFIINKLSSSEAAVLPEDKLQRLVVGVSGFFTNFQQTRVCYFLTLVHLQTRVCVVGSQPAGDCHSH